MSETLRPIAHAAQNPDGSWRDPHDLANHLAGVAALAACHARKFGGEDWAHLAGLWHDLGKYRPRFQHYIRIVSGFDAEAHIKGEAGKAPHSTAGAVLACDRFGAAGRVLAYLIAGHHAGLYDWFGGLDARLDSADSRDELNEALAEHPSADILDHGTFSPDMRAIPGGKEGFALWVRILFSCLVDADFLDTEAYMDAGKAEQRSNWPDVQTLLEQFDSFMARKTVVADPTLVNQLRADILRQCREKAHEAPGLFSLTVPTGGGKTLSSMAFALEHAKRYNKRRIIYVIPYTSIIEQTADIFRDIFGESVIEHHSNAEADPNKETSKSRLACENWDVPIVVTTNVQFFESLFAAKTSRCRKLHNIVDSVVVLDEAQLLPPEFLQPILDVLNLLTQHYGVTVALSTATQPALATREYFDARNNMRGLDNVREIMSDPDALYRALERVNVRLPADWNTPVSWDVLASEISQHDSVLAIVNRRKDARELWELMPEGTLHLSALMCGEHRSQTIRQSKARLKDGIPTRVVSTQLVEAGVDVDFPVVYRALAGLDSIAQAAGRCNREGRLTEHGMQGEVVVFVPLQPAPLGLLRKGEDACRSVLHGHTGKPLERALFALYFEKLYHACDLDAQGIGELLKVSGQTLAVNFRTAAEKFKLIQDEDSAPVIVHYYGLDGNEDKVDELLNTLRKHGPERWLMRKLQRYTVTVHSREAMKLLSQGDVEEAIPGLYVQVSDWLYHPDLGLNPDGLPPKLTNCIA
ncbi:MAG: CRISPR-associated helicase Cas3' [Ferrovum myxofaciens]|uniref:CRISPR-associated helicase Cas3' n=1 Tax=Ferrovum myxofaciens TaxID=416213 RepID=UPI0023564865|nr:CRISPR-associated helicase Cas3' [Ferrovum myxofaciens]QKE41164.1 MAG: CRISPR-associated helicase Cas3' [Ferrovum myxofaciens]